MLAYGTRVVGGVRAGKFSRGGHRYDIRLRFPPKDRMDPSDIKKIWVRNNRGQVLPLSSVVKIEEASPLLRDICGYNPFTYAVETIRFMLYVKFDATSTGCR